jgi:pimeloyl-ACP methyl ester carboxylesterase
MKYLAFFMLGILVIGILLSCGPSTPRFETIECEFNTFSRRDIECGILTVPEDRTRADSPLIQLHFAIFKSKNDKSVNDPIVILVGGPGANALDMVDHLASLFENARNDREIIVFDQRGTGFSRPSLNCPEAESRWYQVWTQDLRWKDTIQSYAEGLKICHDRLIKEGINLEAYTSAANAADVDALRSALGYAKWNLYGESYGTRLALTVMRDYPEGVRSVILDSVYPPQVDLYATLAKDAERALNLIFEHCAADSDCNRRYPEIEADLFKLVSQLDAEPMTFRLPRPSTGEQYDLLVNGDRLIFTLFRMIYSSEQVANLPNLIDSLKEGPSIRLRNQLSWVVFFDDFWSEGMHYSIQCAEETPFSSPQAIEIASGDVTSRIREALDGSTIFVECAPWGITTAPSIENAPVTSAIPTLILAGEFDPITPPAWGRAAAETLSNSQFFELPGASHGVLSSQGEIGNCVQDMVEGFLVNPEDPVGGGCIADLQLAFSVK